MKSALACVLAFAMLHCLAPVLDTTTSGPEPTISAAHPDGAPAEPRHGEGLKLPGVLPHVSTTITAPRETGTIPEPMPGVGPGELHDRIVERPPIATPLLT